MRQTTFQGVVPKVRTEKLGPNFASYAENCLLHSGAIVPIKTMRARGQAVSVMGNLMSKAPQSLYRVGDLDLGFEFFTPIAEDPLHIGDADAFLYVDGGKLWRSSPHWIMDKQGPVQVGINSPCDPPTTAAVEGQDCPGFGFDDDCWAPPYSEDAECENQLPPQVLAFCYTWVTACAEESAPSPYSDPILVERGESVLLTATTPAPPNAVEIRWYMAVADKENALMLYVGASELPAQTSFLLCPDEFAGEEALMTEGWHPMQCGAGVANLGVNSILVWSGEYMYPSVPGQPHAFMDEDKLKVDWPIVRIVSYLNAAGVWEAVVLTEGKPYIVSRDDANKPPQVRLINRMLPCANERAVVVVGDVVYYMSAEGMVMIAGNSANIITSQWFDTRAWHEMGVHHYTLGYYDQRIFAFAIDDQARSFMMPAPLQDNPYERQDVVYISHRATALYTDTFGRMVLTGIGESATTWLWEQGDTNMLAVWECKTVTHAGNTHYTAAKVLTDTIRVRAEAWPYVAMLQEQLGRKPTALEAKDYVRCHPEAAEYINELVGGYTKFTLLAYKEPMFQRPVWNEFPFRLPRNRRMVEWGFSICTTEPVYEVHVDMSMNNLVQEGGIQ